MPIKTYDLGPGTLTIGSGALEVSGQMTNCRMETSESVSSTDPVPVLSGEEKAGSDRVTFTHTLAGNLFQDLDTAGIVAYSFANAGQWVPVTFVPNTSEGASVNDLTSPIPITIGGDVTGTADRRGENPRSDISWRLKPADGDTIADMFTPSV